MLWHGQAVVSAEGAGRVLLFDRPISFWGGIDPVTGKVCDPRHPQFGASICDRVIALPGLVGSSSSSSVMLELLATGNGPAAVIVPAPDAILALGVIVAREMNYRTIPIIELPLDAREGLVNGIDVHVKADGSIVAPDHITDGR